LNGGHGLRPGNKFRNFLAENQGHGTSNFAKHLKPALQMNETAIKTQIEQLALDAGTRQISEIIIHCSATEEGRDVKAADIRRWHITERHWRDIGYHFVIDLDGRVEIGRPLHETGAHCVGHNSNSIGVCYVGGVDSLDRPKDTRTEAQRTAMHILVRRLLQQFPRASVHGHREFAPKDCPCFNVSSEKW
jgi:N-acetylmuramoyl-L-alanine amidase